MQLYSINAGLFKLDGGAMFGVVPKKIWNKLVPADENNLCTWAMRCMLAVGNGKVVLIDCGMGDKQDAKFFGHYEPHGDFSIEASLKQLGMVPGDVTDVFLTHLHFDHCGGAVKRTDKGKLIPTYENARYWSNERQWNWANNPNAREKASFLTENFVPLQQHGVLHFIEEHEELFPGFSTMWTYGHTEAMMLPVIKYNGSKVVYCADLLPSHAHIPLPYVMGYDVRPLITIKEKESFLKEACDKKYFLFFEHDSQHECCSLEKTDKGIRPKNFYQLSELPVNALF
ncbi:MAG TPA: MBL fold metallo-hydrolase [Chitinophagales bacterium]|nr:MBL fold metallo-hydrolase [Chitinophagales bacterium]HRG29372.1 MBL fold metallo-hydrolase [Chitinophagales bacterium]HRG85295.1 MBL fold metallo-hydrolase [Chitinophagales bacterium]HRH53970.1 MBL fold metallo-hydrolase [Chitinophagales bacterium]